jgi:hypothetical protein
MSQVVTVLCEINTISDAKIADRDAVLIINELISMGAANACHLSDKTKEFFMSNGVKSVCVIVPAEKG